MTQSVNDCKEIVNCSTLVELLSYRSREQLEADAFTFLADGENQYTTLSYQELDRQSRRIASHLQALGLTGERALLLYPPGLDYLAGFFGCLYAGVVAVPAYPPRNHRNTPRILSILQDAEVAIVLTTSQVLPQIQFLLKEQVNIVNLRWLPTDNLTPGIENNWQQPIISEETLAFLQYTSGSTDTPKGVMLTHSNLLHNATVTYAYMEHSPSSKFITWLPAYHDMGLIGGILQPLYGGFPCIMMPPAAFLQRPYRWLKVISRYGGTTSGAPNFAYDLCVDRITPEQRSTLDLSSWDVAFNGAEPVRQETLERFCQTFAECGFRPQAFYPCYGMAEATLMVSGSVKSAVPTTVTVGKKELEQNQIIVNPDGGETTSLVSSGFSIPQQQIAIAHPDSCTRCLDGEVGEVWVCSWSVGQGYWNRQQETGETFYAYFQGSNQGPFLRTGDLGFLYDGELFITGRAKDLIIIRGRNLYPQDIERIAESSHPSLRLGGVAVFAVEVENEEKLVVVQELEFRAKPDLEAVITAIRQAISQEFEVQVYAVVLIKSGSIPKTSSGKIQRRATKAGFLADSLNVVKSSIASLQVAGNDTQEISINREYLLSIDIEQRRSKVEAYLQSLVARILTIPLEQVNLQQSLSGLGIDSLQAFEVKNQIEQVSGVSISAVNLFVASIQELGEQIVSDLDDDKAIVNIIQPVARDIDIPLSLAQERLWFLEQLEPGNPFYNVAIAIRLTGKLNPVILEASLNELIKRHESLRTSFHVVDGKPIQVIHDHLEIKLPILQNFDSDFQSIILQETQQAFDLSQLPLLRTKLLHIKENEHLLLISIHHIISDGWSIGVLVQELAQTYTAFSLHKPSPLPKLSIQYADYAYWQRQWLQKNVLQPQLYYWQQQLNSSTALLKIPTDRPRKEIQTFTGQKEFFTITEDIQNAVKKFNQEEGVTLFMTFLAVFKTLLYCYTKQTDILVGSPVFGRNWQGTENLIGFFINTLVFRTNFSENPCFRQVLQQLRACALDAYANQDVPFEKLVEELKPERNLSYNPLFQVMFILQNASIPSLETQTLKWQLEEVDIGTSKFDLKLSLWEDIHEIKGSFEYKTDLFDATTIHRMVRHYEIILRSILEQPNITVEGLINLLTEVDNQQHLEQKRELTDISRNKLKSIKRRIIG